MLKQKVFCKRLLNKQGIEDYDKFLKTAPILTDGIYKTPYRHYESTKDFVERVTLFCNSMENKTQIGSEIGIVNIQYNNNLSECIVSYKE